MSIRKIGLGIRNVKRFPFSFNIKFPEKLKGGRIEKWADYWVTVGTDYREAVLDIIKDSKASPLKASFYIAGIFGICYAISDNPTIDDFTDTLQRYMNESAMMGDKIRNPEVDEHFTYLVDCFNHDLIRRLSFGFGSVLWIDNYSKECGIFKAQCSYLKPRYVTFHERIIDVGFLGTWWNIHNKHKVMDINEAEWTVVDNSSPDNVKEE